MTAPLNGLAAALANRYRLDRELGAGGMATVYLAPDREDFVRLVEHARRRAAEFERAISIAES